MFPLFLERHDLRLVDVDSSFDLLAVKLPVLEILPDGRRVKLKKLS